MQDNRQLVYGSVEALPLILNLSKLHRVCMCVCREGERAEYVIGCWTTTCVIRASNDWIREVGGWQQQFRFCGTSKQPIIPLIMLRFGGIFFPLHFCVVSLASHRTNRLWVIAGPLIREPSIIFMDVRVVNLLSRTQHMFRFFLALILITRCWIASVVMVSVIKTIRMR